MVYVGEPRWPYRRMLMCHMVADTLEELHAMAKSIGIKAIHFQDKRFKHYDICKSKRIIAVNHGAQETTDKEIVKNGWGRHASA